MSQHNRRGIVTMTGAMVFFVVNDALVKWVSADLSTPQLIFVRGVMTQVVGADNVHEFEPTMGAEDFSYFLQEKPGCYFLIGNGDGTHREGGHGLGPCMLHNPSYDFNDELIPLGATMWVRLAEAWLAQPRAGA